VSDTTPRLMITKLCHFIKILSVSMYQYHVIHVCVCAYHKSPRISFKPCFTGCQTSFFRQKSFLLCFFGLLIGVFNFFFFCVNPLVLMKKDPDNLEYCREVLVFSTLVVPVLDVHYLC